MFKVGTVQWGKESNDVTRPTESAEGATTGMKFISQMPTASKVATSASRQVPMLKNEKIVVSIEKRALIVSIDVPVLDFHSLRQTS